ncbi:MAG: glutathione S-transferase family protein [Sandaracinobacter sp.]
MKPMLYHNAMSTCSQKVRLALEEKGVSWESREINLLASEQKSPEYLAINPKGVVPALQVGNAIILESTMINEYIGAHFPGPRLLPVDPESNAAALRWPRKIDEDVHKAFGTITYGTVMRGFMLQMPRESVIADIEKTTDPVHRELRLSLFELGTKAPAFNAAISSLLQFVDDLEAALKNSIWLAGDEFSLADCAAAPYVLRLDHLGLDALWTSGKRPSIDAWYGALRSRQAFDRGVTQWLHDPAISMFRAAGAQLEIV